MQVLRCSLNGYVREGMQGEAAWSTSVDPLALLGDSNFSVCSLGSHSMLLFALSDADLSFLQRAAALAGSSAGAGSWLWLLARETFPLT